MLGETSSTIIMLKHFKAVQINTRSERHFTDHRIPFSAVSVSSFPSNSSVSVLGGSPFSSAILLVTHNTFRRRYYVTPR